MINPLAVLIQYLKTQATPLTVDEDQIASKHRYIEDGWVSGSKSIVCRWDDGPKDDYNAVMIMRIEVRCYGGSQDEAAKVLLNLYDVIKTVHRTKVVLPDASANTLLYYAHRGSGASLLYDDDLNMDYALAFLEIMAGEDSF